MFSRLSQIHNFFISFVLVFFFFCLHFVANLEFNHKSSFLLRWLVNILVSHLSDSLWVFGEWENISLLGMIQLTVSYWFKWSDSKRLCHSPPLSSHIECDSWIKEKLWLDCQKKKWLLLGFRTACWIQHLRDELELSTFLCDLLFVGVLPYRRWVRKLCVLWTVINYTSRTCWANSETRECIALLAHQPLTVFLPQWISQEQGLLYFVSFSLKSIFLLLFRNTLNWSLTSWKKMYYFKKNHIYIYMKW